MVLHHITKCAGLLIERPAAFDPDIFGGRNLYVIDVVTIPDRLENAVRESEKQNVLNGLFAQLVIDAEKLIL